MTRPNNLALRGNARPIRVHLAMCVVALFALATATFGQATTPAEHYTVQRLPRVQESLKPARVVAKDGGAFFIDFGKAAFANLELTLPNPDPGRKITVRLGEMLATGSGEAINRKPGGSVRFLETTLTLEAGKTTYRPTLPRNDAREMPADIGPVMPFRYVELENLPPTITADDLKNGAARQLAVHYVFDDSAADFSCSDDKLNAIWALSKYSIKATSFAGVFVDGDRERKPYEADAYINQLGWYCTTTDTTLPRYTHEYLIQHPTWPTEWIMFSVMTGWEDYRYTGDLTSARAFYDDLKAKTLRALERSAPPDGLISTVRPAVPQSVLRSIHFTGALRDIVDWPVTERDGYDMRPVNTVVNAFHCHSLNQMSRLAAALGKTADAQDFAAAAKLATDSLNAKLVDPATGLYLDGEGSTHSSLHANMFLLAFGLVPADRQARVADFVQSRGMACSVYGAQFLLDALFDHGRADAAIALMTAPGDRSWRHMVEDVGTTITLEAWDTKYKPNQDWNHAWGAAPANILPRKILGVEPLDPPAPLSPGMTNLLVWPRAGQLLSAKGKVPTVKGPVTVNWQRGASSFRLQVELPEGMTARVGLPLDAVPVGQKPVVEMDGKPTPSQESAGALFVDPVGPGRHLLTLHG